MTPEPNVNLLVVDDNAGQRMALAAILAGLDVNIVQAGSGREALRCLLQQEFAVILLDVNMPGMDGFETATLIRARPASQTTPIIFVTAYADDTYAARGYSLGAVDYILSPVQPDILRTKVAVFLDLYRKAGQIKRQSEALARYASQLQRLNDASLAINSAAAIEEVLETTAASAAKIVGAHQVSISATLQGGTTSLTVTQASEKYGGRRTARRSGPLNLPTFGLLRPVRLAAASLANARTAQVPTEILPGVPLRGWLATPVVHARDDRTIGIVQLSEKDDGDFTPEDENIVVQLARMAAVAIDNLVAMEAREANRLKDEFLGVLSHELRTPLHAMLMWVSILRRDGIDSTTHARGLEAVERSARAQAQLIEDLLDISRIIRGQLRLETGPVDLIHVTAQAIETLRPAAAAKSITIQFVPPVQSCRTTGDATRLQQVVWNILSNGVKFTPPQGRIEISLLPQPDHFALSVRDSGSGITASFLPHVFDRFRQADSSTARQQGGLGLGLAIVRHLVELHGGRVHADNAPKGGAIFTVHLPRVSAPLLPLSTAAVCANGPADATRSTVRLDGIRIVLVEDEVEGREGLVTALKLYGAEVVAVDTTEAALDAIERTQPHVLLSDIGIPGSDGYALIRQVRAREGGNARVPAAALTAYVRPEDRNLAVEAGFDTHVPKPIEPLELARMVRELASGGSTPSPQRGAAEG